MANNEEIHSSILHSTRTLLDLQLLINIMSVEEIPEVRSHPTLYYRFYSDDKSGGGNGDGNGRTDRRGCWMLVTGYQSRAYYYERT